MNGWCRIKSNMRAQQACCKMECMQFVSDRVETIILTCSCGATFSRGCNSYVGNMPNPNGRKFEAEIAADEWLDMHADCKHRSKP